MVVNPISTPNCIWRRAPTQVKCRSQSSKDTSRHTWICQGSHVSIDALLKCGHGQWPRQPLICIPSLATQTVIMLHILGGRLWQLTDNLFTQTPFLDSVWDVVLELWVRLRKVLRPILSNCGEADNLALVCQSRARALATPWLCDLCLHRPRRETRHARNVHPQVHKKRDV